MPVDIKHQVVDAIKQSFFYTVCCMDVMSVILQLFEKYGIARKNLIGLCLDVVQYLYIW